MRVNLRQLPAGVFRSGVAWSMLVIVLRVGGFTAVMGVALRMLAREWIGLWYGMLSLTVAASCVELGFASTIARLTGYYWAGAARVPALGLEGVRASTGRPNAGALRGIVNDAGRIYGALAAIYLLVAVGIACGWLWILPPEERHAAGLLSALGVLILGGTWNMAVSYWPSLLLGLQEVRDYGVYAAAGLVVGYVVALSGLLLGGGLVALAGGVVVQSLATRALARRHVVSWLREQGPADPVHTSWRVLWPTTWRVGLAQAAAYLILPITPLLISTLSLKEAASFGLSVQAALILQTLSTSWITIKWPLFGYLRAAGRLMDVRRIAEQRLILSVVTFLACAGVVPFVAPVLLAHIGSRTPFVTTLTWFMLALATGIDLLVSVHAGLIQTGNRVSHLKAFVLTGVLNVSAAAWLARSYGTTGVLASVIISPLLINIWWLPREAWRQLHEPAIPEGLTS